MAIYQRGKNWYIDFTFKGQRIRESIGPSRKGAEKVIVKKKAEIAENKYLDVRKDPDPIKFHDFAKEYLQWAKANKKPTTYSRDVSIMRTLDAEFGSRGLHEITVWQIEKFKAARKEDHNIASVNREIAILRHFFNKAVEWGKLKENPAKKVKLFKGVTNRVRYLMPEEVQVLLSNCEGMAKEITTVAIHTGMRRGEILKLRKENVDFGSGTVCVMDTKNHERRDIPMNNTVKAILATLTEGKQGSEYVFSDREGRGVSRKILETHFPEALKKSGITNFRFHDCRHTFASNLVMAGKDLNTVRELLGHKSLAMTLRYAHLAPNLKKEAVETLGRILSQNPPQTGSLAKVVPIMH